MKRIIIVRHGDTKATEEGRYHGVIDTALSKKGKGQIKKLSRWLKRYDITHVYTSPLKRCKESADILIKENDIGLDVIPELREIDFGVWEGMTMREIMKKYPKEFNDWTNGFRHFRMPGGEKVTDMKKRVEKAFKKVLSRHKDGNILIVTHGGPVRIMLMNVLNGALDYFWRFHVNAGSASVIEFVSKEPIVRCFNAVP